MFDWLVSIFSRLIVEYTNSIPILFARGSEILIDTDIAEKMCPRKLCTHWVETMKIKSWKIGC